MKSKLFNLIFVFIFLLNFLSPLLASAHEVYVLSREEVTRDVKMHALNFAETINSEKLTFLISGAIMFLLVLLVLKISVSSKLQNRLYPFFASLKPYAGYVVQITIGLSLFASVYFESLFGPELSITKLFGEYSTLAEVFLYISSVSILFGIYPRIGALIATVVYMYVALAMKGDYMFSYLTYLGEALIILFLGGSYKILEINSEISSSKIRELLYSIKKRKYLIITKFLGISQVYSAYYAKFIHGALALDTVSKYNLASYFLFEPMFIVLGAFLTEVMIGIFYIIGFEIRFISIVFLIFLTLSMNFFGEAVWPHIILIGTAIAMLMHGYDEFTILKHWYTKGEKEPVL